MREQYSRHFMRMAWLTALNLSKDPETKVGAVITSPDTRQLSVGYNGFPVGVDEAPERWERPEKYNWVIHAEINAIMNCPFDTKGSHLFCTHQPCCDCLGAIINARIETVTYCLPYSTMTSDDQVRWRELSERVLIQQLNDPMVGSLQKIYEIN